MNPSFEPMQPFTKGTGLLLTVSGNKIYLKQQGYTFNQSEWLSGQRHRLTIRRSALLPTELIRELNDYLILVKRIVAL